MNTEQKEDIHKQSDLIPLRLGNVILGFPKGTSLESGARITKETQHVNPEVWSRVPGKIRRTIEDGIGTLFIDTVGNTAFQITYKIPEIPTRNQSVGNVIDITPRLTASQSVLDNDGLSRAGD